MIDTASANEVKQLMVKASVGLLATTDGQAATVRPMSTWLWDGPDLLCATTRGSSKLSEISLRASAEYCFVTERWDHLCISGTVVVEAEPSLKKRLYDSHLGVREIFTSPEDPELCYLRMKVGRIRIMGRDMAYRDVTVAEEATHARGGRRWRHERIQTS